MTTFDPTAIYIICYLLAVAALWRVLVELQKEQDAQAECRELRRAAVRFAERMAFRGLREMQVGIRKEVYRSK